MNEAYEKNLPPYLASDSEAWKKGACDRLNGKNGI